MAILELGRVGRGERDPMELQERRAHQGQLQPCGRWVVGPRFPESVLNLRLCPSHLCPLIRDYA